MPPFVALILWLVLLLLLLVFDPAKESKPSLALWVPLIWLFILGSRLPTQWLGLQTMSTQAQVLEDGDPLNRTFFFLLIALAIAILFARSVRWGDFVFRNMALVAFIVYALSSVFWSDFAFIVFKRWYRDLGNYLMVLVILSDSRPTEAMSSVVRRLCYLLIPLSILIIKYFPQMGRIYDPWTGLALDAGATTSKNMLGFVCLLSGVYFFWDTLIRWSVRKAQPAKRIIKVNIAFLAMTLWLLNFAHSATSTVCLGIGCVVVALTRSRLGRRYPGLLKFLIPVSFCIYLLLAFGFDYMGDLAKFVGRNPTLTDRTLVWNIVLNMHTNPIIGTGYESFWLGPRLLQVWRKMGGVNEAHNGYIEVYLNLGLIGLFLIAGLMITSYRNICKQLNESSSVASLSLAVWVIVLFYNMTEVGFRSGLLWIMFLFGAITVRQKSEEQVPIMAPFGNTSSSAPVFRPGFEVARQRR